MVTHYSADEVAAMLEADEVANGYKHCTCYTVLTIIVNKEMSVVWGVVTRNGCGFK